MDIESYFAGAFTKADQDLVEACAAILAKYLDKG
jgi:putative methionine-R-sulfoxide reductase with GAF domain